MHEPCTRSSRCSCRSVKAGHRRASSGLISQAGRCCSTEMRTIWADAPQSRMRLLTVIAAAVSASTIAAPSTDPLHADGCVSAMSALHDVEDAVVASAKASPGVSAFDSRVLSQLADLKRLAARTCLGGDGTLSKAPRPASQQPVFVAPTVVFPWPSGPQLPARTTAPPSPVSVAPLKSITSCDAAGCWVNDGTRLQRIGPQLLGPRGFCSVLGSMVNCP